MAESLRQLGRGLRVFGVTSQPATLARIALAGLPRYGMTVAGAIAVTARIRGDRVALLDGRGAVTHAELGRAVHRLAAALDHHRLAGPGTRLAVVCDDDRDLLITAARSRAGRRRGLPALPTDGKGGLRCLAGRSGAELILHAPAAAGLADGVATQTLSTTDLDDLVASTPARHRAPERPAGRPR